MASRHIDATLRFHDEFSNPMKRAVAGMNGMTDKIMAQNKAIINKGKEMQRMGKNMQRMGRSWTRNVTVPLLAIGGASMKLAGDFKKSMANINTLLDDQSHLKSYERQVLKTASNIGIDAKIAADGMYQTISVLGDHGKQTEKTFDIMARAAKAGGADVQDAVNMIATAMNGYGDISDKTASKLSDLAFMTAKLGKTKFPELAQSMSSLFPLGKNLGLSYEELYASMSTATTSFAGDTAEAATAMKGLMTGFLKPSKDMQALYQKLGVSSGQQLIKQKGLAGAMEEVQKVAGKDGMPKYFKNIRGLTAALGLSGEGMEKFKEHLKKMENAKGMTDKALAKVQAANKLNDAINRMKVAGIQFGSALLPIVVPAIEKIAKGVERLAKWYDGLGKHQKKALNYFLIFLAAIGPGLTLFGRMFSGLGGLVKGFGKLAKAADKARVASKAVGSAEWLKKLDKGLDKISTSLMDGFSAWRERTSANLGVIKARISGFSTSSKEKMSSLASAMSGKFKSARSEMSASFRAWRENTASDMRYMKERAGNVAASMRKKMVSAAKAIGRGFKAMGKAVVSAFKAVGRAALAAFKAIGRGLMIVGKFLLANPIILIIAAIAVAAFLIIKNWKKVKAFFAPLIEWFKKAGAKIKKVFGGIKNKVGDMKDGMQKHLSKAGKRMSAFAKSCMKSSSGVKGYFGGILKFLSGVFTGNWKKAWEGIKQVYKSIWNSFKNIAKKPINFVIGMINKLIAGINKLKISIPNKKWIPKAFRGASFGFNISPIPQLAKGSHFTRAGMTLVGEEGPELVDMPRGARVHNARDTKRMVSGRSVTIAKLADTIVVREEADIDKIATKIVQKLEDTSGNVPVLT